MLQIIEYDFISTHVDDNTTEEIPVLNTNRRDTILVFDIIEWICKSLYNERNLEVIITKYTGWLKSFESKNERMCIF